jgi:hypothetical protein
MTLKKLNDVALVIPRECFNSAGLCGIIKPVEAENGPYP